MQERERGREEGGSSIIPGQDRVRGGKKERVRGEGEFKMALVFPFFINPFVHIFFLNCGGK